MRSSSPKLAKLHRRLRRLVVCLAVVSSVLVTFPVVHSQNPPAPTLQGQSQTVLLLPHQTVNAGNVHFKPDSDHDGMSDEDEGENGTDPNDSSDADADADGDGLSNGDEVAGGSNVNNSDSDGDGVSDGDEARLGYDPRNPGNTPPPNTSVVAVQVTPNQFSLTNNTILGPQVVQLRVTGTLNSGATVDLTASPDTTYETANAAVAFVASDGRVAGTGPGSVVLTVRNGAHTATASVTVTRFTPGPVSSIVIPGYANNVEVAGNYAFVAAGATGLQIVNVTDKAAPQMVGSFNTPGNANDVVVSGNLAYVADGAAGLQIIDVTNVTAPSLAGSADTPGQALDVVVYGSRAYVADGTAGLQVFDVATPTAPALVSGIDLPGTARGVDVSGEYALVAEDSPVEQVSVVDLGNEASPRVAGQLAMPGSPKDLVVRDQTAYVAAYTAGLCVVDFSQPASPALVGVAESDTAGRPRDVVLTGSVAVLAEQLFANAVPFIEVQNPASPVYRGALSFSNEVFPGTGIALDQQYVYKTAQANGISAEDGVTGNTRLFIGHYQSITDGGTTPPNVSIDAPRNGDSASEGGTLALAATAIDDIQVAGVQFVVNGANVGSPDTFPPYRVGYVVPVGATSLSVTAVATDLAGNRATSTPVVVPVTPDTPPQVALTNPAAGATLYRGQSVNLTAAATDNGRVRQVVYAVNGVALEPALSAPFSRAYLVPADATSLTIEATATDNLGKTATASQTHPVEPDPGTTVSGRVLDETGSPVVNATVRVFGEYTATTAGDGRFSVEGVPFSRGDVTAYAEAHIDGRKLVGASGTAAPVAGGVTDVGEIALAPLARIAFTTSRNRTQNSFSNREIYVMNADGSDQTRLTNNTVSDIAAIFSPDGSKLAFNSDRGGNSRGLYVMNADGTEPRLIDSSSFDWAWSSDSRRLAFVSNSLAFVADADGGNRVQLTPQSGVNELSWSADGSRIAFISSHGGSRNVYVVRPDGTDLRQLTNDTQQKFDVSISPDGSKVGYVRRQPDSFSLYDLFVANTDGSGSVAVSEEGSDYYDLEWMPDGVRLAAIKDTGISGLGSSIWMFDTEGGAPPRRVSNTNGGFDWGTAVSPDGTRFAFASDDGLYVVNADGTGQQLVSPDDWDPTWAPPLPRVTGARTTVTGRLTDEQDRPVAGAAVSAFDRYSATSGVDGSFSIENVPTTLGPVVVSASGTVDNQGVLAASAPASPVGGGVTNVGTIVLRAMGFETRYGNVVDFFPTDPDDSSVAIDLPFTFNYYGRAYTRVYVGSNGYLTFNSGDDKWTETLSAFGNGQPRIAALFDDWVVVGETATSGIFVNSALPGRVVFTWANVLAYANYETPAQAEKATFQVTLHQDGRVEMGYRGVETRGGLTGVTPGGGSFEDSPTVFMDDISASPLFLLSTYEFSYYELFSGATSQRPFDLDKHFIRLAPQEGGGYQVSVQFPLQTKVRGVLHDANGSPARGVRVMAQDRYAVTNSDGSFEIFGVSAEGGAVAAAVTHQALDGQVFEAQSNAFTPIANGVTDVGTLVLQPTGAAFDSDLGQLVTIAPGAAGTQFPLPFPFRFYGASQFGATYDTVYVNSAGYLKFAGGCVREDCADGYGTADTAVNEHALIYSRVPVIAPLYSALDAATGQVYVKSEADRWVLTFKNVRSSAAAAGDNTFQVVLRADGRIRFAYDGVSNTFAHVGLAPGGFVGFNEETTSVDWSQFLLRTTVKATPLVETFTGDFGGQPSTRPFDLDHSVMTFVPRAGLGYDVLRQRLPGHESHRRLFFDSGRDGAYHVWMMNDDGSDQVRVTHHPGDNYFAALSPDRTKIVFTTDRHYTDETFESKIYAMNADGSDERMLSDVAGDEYRPVWSPDGTRILYTRYIDDSEIYVMNADGTNKVRLTNHPDANQSASWSPDGARIVFEEWGDNGPHVYVMNADGTGGKTKVSGDDLERAYDPSFSPDGSRIVFIASVPNGLPHVYVVNADGTGQVRVTGEAMGAFEPTWSPDGTRIAYREFASPHFAGEELYVVGADGSNPTRLTNNATGEGFPRWSPDGAKIAFWVYQDGSHGQIYVMNSDGSNVRNISASRWHDFFNEWLVVP